MAAKRKPPASQGSDEEFDLSAGYDEEEFDLSAGYEDEDEDEDETDEDEDEDEYEDTEEDDKPSAPRISPRTLKIVGIILAVLGLVGAGVIFLRPSRPGGELMGDYAAILADEKDFGGGLTYPDFGARQLKVLEWIDKGYITSSSDDFVTISVTSKKGTVAEFEIMIHEMRVGNDESFYMIPLDGPHSLAACKVRGLDLPTRWMSHEFRRKVFKDGGKLGFIAYPEIKASLGEPLEANDRDYSLRGLGRRKGPQESETPKVIKGRGDLFMKLLAQVNLKPDQPVSGHFKEVIQDPMVKDKLATLRGCEGQLADNWEQSPNFGCSLVADIHPPRFLDYSHGVRCVKPELKVDGKTLTLKEFYDSKEYRAEFVLGHLPLREPSYVYPPHLQKWMEEHGYAKPSP